MKFKRQLAFNAESVGFELLMVAIAMMQSFGSWLKIREGGMDLNGV